MSVEQLALEFGYVGLFVLSFVAATLIAAPADVVAMAMPPLGYHPVWVGVVATAGGYLGNLVNYMVGKYGAAFVLARFVQPGEGEQRWIERARRIYEQYGVWSLLMSGLPFIGDPLTTVAGMFRVQLVAFTVIVVAAKVVKFAVLLGAVGYFF